jgi:hypothetical protein
MSPVKIVREKDIEGEGLTLISVAVWIKTTIRPWSSIEYSPVTMRARIITGLLQQSRLCHGARLVGAHWCEPQR